MRAFGYRVVDRIVDHLTTLDAQHAGRTTDRSTLEALLRESPPDLGSDPESVLDRIERDVLTHMGRVHHPRFFAFVPSPANYVAVLSDALAAAYNVFAGTWIESSGPAMLEIVTLDWLREWCGMPEGAGGVFTSGGSMASLTALAAARHDRLGDDLDGAVAYASDQTHTAIDRALRVLGFGSSQLRRLPSNERYALDPDVLSAWIAEDRASGKRPFCVIANAGTTNTGAVDPLDRLAEVCERERLWLHVDAAYGGPAILTERGRRDLVGLGAADSLALDPHKWLFQPYEIGCTLVREPRLLAETFAVRPDYLRDTETDGGEVNFADRSVQLTRSFRALKLWFTIQVFGLDAIRAAIDVGLDLAEYAEEVLRDSKVWEVVTPAQLAIVSFRYAPAGVPPQEADRITAALVEASIDDGHTMVSSTTLGGRLALRLCTINPRTTRDDIASSIAKLESLAAERLGA